MYTINACTLYMKIGMVIPLLSHFACAPYKCVDLASPSCFTCRSCEGWQHQCPCSRVLSCYLGLAITVYMHCIVRIFGNFPANKTVCTPYIYGSGRPYCYACVYMCAHIHTHTHMFASFTHASNATALFLQSREGWQHQCPCSWMHCCRGGQPCVAWRTRARTDTQVRDV